MIKIILLEDRHDQARIITQMIERYGAEHEHFRYTLQHFDRSIAMLEAYKGDADLMLLDIRMPDMLGIDAAKRIREMDSRVMIVFITTLAQYAIEGYAVHAFDYVLKPVSYDAFAAKMDRVCRRLAYLHPGVSIDVQTRDAFYRLSSDEIYYLEVSNHDVLIHTDRGVLRQWGSLKTFEEALSAAHFVRCNACYLVNLKYVHGIRGDRALVGEDELAISKPRRKEFLTAVAQYKGGTR